MKRFGAPLLAAFLVGACATQQTAPGGERECAEWFRSLDARVAERGVRDAQARPVEGFPYLRVNRLLAALRDDAAAEESKRQALVARMQSLDAEGRGVEVANLGVGEVDARATLEQVRSCGTAMREADLSDPDTAARLLEHARVPDDYSDAMRFFGLYALTKYPFFSGVSQYQEDVRAAFERAGAPARRYAPPASPAFSRAAQAEALASASADPLGIPEPRGQTLEGLFAAHAPVFVLRATQSFCAYKRNWA